MNIQTNIELEVTECCVCTVRFAVPDTLMAHRRRHAGSIYCPNGHCIGWSESDADKLRKQLEEKQRELTASKSAEMALRMKCESVEKEMARHKKRSAAGVCPCCTRTFQQLARHMKQKHPNFQP